MSHQDWTTITLSKKPTKADAIKNGQVETIKRPLAADINSIKIERIVDSEDGKLEIKLIDSKAVNAVKQARSAQNLTQKDLANKACVPEATIKSLEQGREKHNPQLLTKLQRVLGVKLLGENIGSTIEPKTK